MTENYSPTVSDKEVLTPIPWDSLTWNKGGL